VSVASEGQTRPRVPGSIRYQSRPHRTEAREDQVLRFRARPRTVHGAQCVRRSRRSAGCPRAGEYRGAYARVLRGDV